MVNYPTSFRVGQDGASREYPHRVDYTVTSYVDGVEARTSSSFAFFISDGHADAMIRRWNAMSSKPSAIGKRTYVYARVGTYASLEQHMRGILTDMVRQFGERGASDGRMLPAARQPTPIAEAMLLLGMR